MRELYVITGPAGVGKSTISTKIAERKEKCALLEGDEIYHFVRGGYVSPWKEGNHLDIFWENVFCLIENFLTKGYDVVFNYILKKKDQERIQELFPNVKIKFVVLLTDEETIVKRDKERPLDCQMGERCKILLEQFKKQNFEEQFILDTSKLTVDETVETILEENLFLVH